MKKPLVQIPDIEIFGHKLYCYPKTPGEEKLISEIIKEAEVEYREYNGENIGKIPLNKIEIQDEDDLFFGR